MCTVTGEVYCDGPTLLILALQRLRPDTVVDVFKKIEILKALRLKDFNLDLPMLIDSLNEKNDEIQDLDPNAYSETQLASDTFRMFSLDAPEAFRQWMEKDQMNWATGETAFNSFDLQQRATKVFMNLTSTGRWKKSFDQKDQIIALTTEIATLKKKVQSTPAVPTTAYQPTGGLKRDTDKKDEFKAVKAWMG